MPAPIPDPLDDAPTARMGLPPAPLSGNFSVGEFACHSGEPYPAEWIDDRLRPLVAVLERLRAELGGRPIWIVSGYRSPAHNVAVGGALHSQHVAGRAADVRVDGVAPSDVYYAAIRLHKAGAIRLGGAGRYPGWTHLDVRPAPDDGHLCAWVGAKVGDEVA